MHEIRYLFYPVRIFAHFASANHRVRRTTGSHLIVETKRSRISCCSCLFSVMMMISSVSVVVAFIIEKHVGKVFVVRAWHVCQTTSVTVSRGHCWLSLWTSLMMMMIMIMIRWLVVGLDRKRFLLVRYERLFTSLRCHWHLSALSSHVVIVWRCVPNTRVDGCWFCLMIVIVVVCVHACGWVHVGECGHGDAVVVVFVGRAARRRTACCVLQLELACLLDQFICD